MPIWGAMSRSFRKDPLRTTPSRLRSLRKPRSVSTVSKAMRRVSPGAIGVSKVKMR